MGLLAVMNEATRPLSVNLQAATNLKPIADPQKGHCSSRMRSSVEPDAAKASTSRDTLLAFFVLNIFSANT